MNSNRINNLITRKCKTPIVKINKVNRFRYSNQMEKKRKIILKSRNRISKKQSIKTIISKKQPIKTIISKKQSIRTIISKKQSIKTIISKRQSIKTIISKKQPIKTIISKRQSIKAIISKKQSIKTIMSIFEINNQICLITLCRRYSLPGISLIRGTPIKMIYRYTYNQAIISTHFSFKKIKKSQESKFCLKKSTELINRKDRTNKGNRNRDNKMKN